MKSKFILTESERNRILGLHKSAIKKEFLIEQTQYIKDAAGKVSILQGPQVVPQGSTAITQQEYETALKTQNPPANQPAAAPTTPTTTVAPTSNPNNEVLLQGTDKDYDYKKVGDKYYFKLKENPTSVGAKGYKTQGKFKDWTLATNQEAIKKISQLPALSTAAAFQAPKVGDGSDEKFDAPVQTVGTTPTNSQPTGPVPTNTPVKYPWIGADGRESLQSIETALKTDPNLQKFLGELRKLSADQLRTVQQDLRNFYVRMSSANMDPMSNQGYLIADQTVKDAIKILKKASEGAS